MSTLKTATSVWGELDLVGSLLSPATAPQCRNVVMCQMGIASEQPQRNLGEHERLLGRPSAAAVAAPQTVKLLAIVSCGTAQHSSLFLNSTNDLQMKLL